MRRRLDDGWLRSLVCDALLLLLLDHDGVPALADLHLDEVEHLLVDDVVRVFVTQLQGQ